MSFRARLVSVTSPVVSSDAAASARDRAVAHRGLRGAAGHGAFEATRRGDEITRFVGKQAAQVDGFGSRLVGILGDVLEATQGKFAFRAVLVRFARHHIVLAKFGERGHERSRTGEALVPGGQLLGQFGGFDGHLPFAGRQQTFGEGAVGPRAHIGGQTVKAGHAEHLAKD